MTSYGKAIFEHLQTFTKIGNLVKIIPITLTLIQPENQFKVELRPSGTLVRLFWKGVILTSVGISCLEVFYCFFIKPEVKVDNLLALIFNVFNLACQMAGVFMIDCVQNKPQDFIRLLNNIFKAMKKFGASASLFSLVSFQSNVMLATFPFGIGVLVFCKPGLHPFLLKIGFPGFLLPFLDFTGITTVAFIASWIAPVCILSLYYSLTMLKAIKIRKSSEVESTDETNLEYRKAQIFVGLANICFQNCLFPVVQFVGGLLGILMLFVVVKFWDNITSLALLGVIGVFLSILGFVTIVLDFGSRPMCVSKKVLTKWRKFSGESRGNRAYLLKVIRACPVISLNMGGFNKLDRGRAPALLRACLRRTFFLVFNSEQSE